MKTRRYINEQPGIAGEMSMSFDLTMGRIEASGSGFWSVKQASDYFDDWRSIVSDIHARDLPLSALIDMGDGQVQSSEVAAIIGSVTSEMYRPGDAIAMLVPSSLAKMQMRRVLDPRYHEFFISRSAAETWLTGRGAGQKLAV